MMKSLASIFLEGPTEEYKQWRACSNKRPFTEEYAKSDAARINRKNVRNRDNHRVCAYYCETCFQWHVGGVKGFPQGSCDPSSQGFDHQP